jgi:hypothetical protein
MTAQNDLDELAQCLAVTVAPSLALAVHVGDGHRVGALLEPLTRQELLALAVVLADQVGQPRTRPEDGVIDEVAIARAIGGQDVTLTRSERTQAVLRMREAGATPTVIAKRLHLSGRRVREALAEQEAK